jgi:hypothetical protein
VVSAMTPPDDQPPEVGGGGRATTWRDYCKHYGPCITYGGDRCHAAEDPAYVAEMNRRETTLPVEGIS